MEISPVNRISLSSLQDYLSSPKISNNEKVDFLQKNRTEIKELISAKEFKGMMNQRPLKKFRPLRNSFTKRGDKILLAMSLDIEPNEVDNYIDNFYYDYLQHNHEELKKEDEDRVNKIKTYVFRHGTKQQVIDMLDYQLSVADDKLEFLYQTLQYNTGGVADYFTRPIHRMDNSTLIDIYHVVDSHLDKMEKNGSMTAADRDRTSQWALVQIYKIQNNQKLIKAKNVYDSIR